MDKKLLFLLGCIPIRSLLVWYVKTYPTQNIGYLLFIIAFRFLYLYFNNLRLKAGESSSGITWWASYRLIHGLLYLSAAIYMFKNKQYGWIPLLVDVLLGLVLWIFNYL